MEPSAFLVKLDREADVRLPFRDGRGGPCNSESVVGPLEYVDHDVKKLSNGVKGPLYQALATRLVIASTGAMLIVGHEAPCRISALACRIESRKHIGKEGNFRQVSGTSDASKMQSGLTGN
jgi:hypothetical protein